MNFGNTKNFSQTCNAAKLTNFSLSESDHQCLRIADAVDMFGYQPHPHHRLQASVHLA